MAIIIDEVAHVTLEEAAEVLNTTQLRVLMLIKEQALAGSEVNGAWYISNPSLACAVAHGKDQRTARGCNTYCSSSGCGCG
jgi:hypothetical protein